MSTGQNYAGRAACTTPFEPTARQITIPLHLLDEVNWELQELTQLLQNPSTVSIKADLVSAAINAAYHLGTEQMPVNNLAAYLPLYVSRPTSGSQMSHFEIVLEALTSYRRSMVAMRNNYGLDVAAEIDEIQSAMLDQLYRITSNLID
jgi:hypothetical protein